MKSLLLAIILTVGLTAGESHQCNKALKDFHEKNKNVEKKQIVVLLKKLKYL